MIFLPPYFYKRIINTMSKRNTQQRRHTIIQLLEEQGKLSVDELAKRFETSEVTIRKDLTALEQNGLLLRRYGGAVPIPTELLPEVETDKVSQYKIDIAIAAALRIRDHNRIIIDSGTTTASLIEQLANKKGLITMTNSLHVANALNGLENEPTLLMTGGTWDPHSESFQGQIAEQVLRSYDFDQLFIGADGVDLARGTTTFNELIGLSRVMAEVSREVVVMVESDKISRKMPNLELAWDNIHTLITDAGITNEQRHAIESKNIDVVIAPTQKVSINENKFNTEI